jgi:hypothetical protein
MNGAVSRFSMLNGCEDLHLPAIEPLYQSAEWFAQASGVWFDLQVTFAQLSSTAAPL